MRKIRTLLVATLIGALMLGFVACEPAVDNSVTETDAAVEVLE